MKILRPSKILKPSVDYSLVGAFDDGNFGDDWQLSIFCRELIARHSECKIRIRSDSLFSKNLEKQFEPQVQATSRRFFLFRSTQILVGGEIYFRNPHVKSHSVTYPQKLFVSLLGFLVRCLAIIRYSSANTNVFAKRTYAFAIGFGNLSGVPTYRKMRICYELRNLTYLLFRDSVSQNNFQEFLDSPPFETNISVDLSFLETPIQETRPTSVSISLVIRRTTFASKEDLLILVLGLQKLANQLLVDFNVFLCQKDSVLEDFLRENEILDFRAYDGLNLEEFMSELDSSSHIFSMRLHPILYGASRGRRVYSLGLDQKFSKSVGNNLMNFSLCEFNSMTSQEFGEILESPVIYSAAEVQSMHSQLKIEFDGLVKVLKSLETDT
jgi:polysaccharide pyruvyl transferase WcaK-like protein